MNDSVGISDLSLLITLAVSSVVAVSFAYSALPSQRRWSPLFAPFPSRVTAILAAIVALRAWIEVLGGVHGALVWFSTLVVPVTVLLVAGWRADHDLSTR
jgi:hypothetical protein